MYDMEMKRLKKQMRDTETMIMKKKIFRRILSIILVVVGIGFCVVAFLGHKPAYSAAACCFFAAIPVLLSNKQKSKKL